MTRRWLTIASPTEEAMINPIVAGCERGYVPTEVTVLSNPSVRSDADPVVPVIEAILDEYGDGGTVAFHDLDSETDYEAIASFFQSAIVEATEADDESVAVDITPGRKFMSAIAFQAGARFGADHVFYLLLDSSDYYGQIYPDIPETATELVDFSEVV